MSDTEDQMREKGQMLQGDSYRWKLFRVRIHHKDMAPARLYRDCEFNVLWYVTRPGVRPRAPEC